MQLFETERLFARKLSHQDLSALAEILSDPEVMEYSVRGVCDVAATKKFIDWCVECYASRGIGPWALVKKDSGDLIGFCGVGPELVAGVEETNLGYRLARKFWNQGFATEAAIGVLGYAFGQKKFSSVVVIIEQENGASVRVSEKAGFRHYTTLEFHGQSVRLYRMTCRDWSILHNKYG
ncbi:GNAT family N-acetyltransferase [Marinobacter halophilus]|uniref:GNAT family N-acetyltransferase n=1 Tax=Marinobacter halophilus TaxID=1323740 RepID=A0A2T1KGN7_9GAMM|nr:GNAT family N-acetyltransferase [Marinobacter halophilus]PSF09296.1 GNAT family N-acetyltransferase [Marinobacter halophilus]GGC79115.1 N-acetyltransferase [Marinobacter halophilus]